MVPLSQAYPPGELQGFANTDGQTPGEHVGVESKGIRPGTEECTVRSDQMRSAQPRSLESLDLMCPLI